MASIKVYREWTIWENEGDDEPTKVKESEETYDCVLDEIDRAEGLTVVDLAVHTLERKLYVDETSAYPWQVGSWYAGTPGDDHSYGMDGACERFTAHLEGFNADEEAAIFEDLKKRNPHWR